MLNEKEILVDLLKEELVRGSHAIFEKRLVQRGEGNISIRVPGTNEFLITPTYNDYKNMTAEDVVHMNLEGEQISGNKRASSEFRLHVALYKERPNVGAVVHTHSFYATMLAVARKDLPVILEEMVVWVGGPVRCAEFGEANTDEVAEKVLDAFKDTNAILIANHGVLACGKSMHDAVKVAELVEKMAGIYKGATDYGRVHTITGKSFDHFRKKYDEYYSTL